MSISKKDYGGYVVEVLTLSGRGTKQFYCSYIPCFEDAVDFATILARRYPEVTVRPFEGSQVIWAGGLSYV